MVHTNTKFRKFALPDTVLVIAITAIIAIGANSTTVAAQTQPCTTILSYPVMPATYSFSNVPIVVPMSATCTTAFGNTIYVSGNAYDATSNIGLGIVNSVLQSNDGGITFNGQLGFNLPPTTQGHTVTISASLYANQYGSLISSTSETFQAVTGSQQVATTTVLQPYPVPIQSASPAPYQSPYPTQSPSIQGQLRPRPYRNLSQYQTVNQNSSLLGYIAIVAILAAVVIAAVGLIAFERHRQQHPSVTWVPAPPPPPRT